MIKPPELLLLTPGSKGGPVGCHIYTHRGGGCNCWAWMSVWEFTALVLLAARVEPGSRYFLFRWPTRMSSDRWAKGNLKEPEFCQATCQAKPTAIMVRMIRLDAPPLLTQSFAVIRPSAWGKGTSSHWVSLSLPRVGKLWMEIPHGGWKLLPKSPTSEEPRGVYIQAGFNLLPVFGQVGGGTWESPGRSQRWRGPWLSAAPFWVNSAGSGTDAHSCVKGAAGGIMAAVCAGVQTVPHRPGLGKQWGNKQPSEQCTHFLSSHWAEWGSVGWFHLTKSPPQTTSFEQPVVHQAWQTHRQRREMTSIWDVSYLRPAKQDLI